MSCAHREPQHAKGPIGRKNGQFALFQGLCSPSERRLPSFVHVCITGLCDVCWMHKRGLDWNPHGGERGCQTSPWRPLVVGPTPDWFLIGSLVVFPICPTSQNICSFGEMTKLLFTYGAIVIFSVLFTWSWGNCNILNVFFVFRLRDWPRFTTICQND